MEARSPPVSWRIWEEEVVLVASTGEISELKGR